MSSTVATLSYQLCHLILRKLLRGCDFNLQIRYKNQDRLDYAVVIDSPVSQGLIPHFDYMSMAGACPSRDGGLWGSEPFLLE